MRRLAWLPFFLCLPALACSTHPGTGCLPPCGATDRLGFAHCVADGLSDGPDGACLAGNRRCCALAQRCVGQLEDQTVTPSAEECNVLVEDECYPACTADDVSLFDLCLIMGDDLCEIGDGDCCALSADCLGTLRDRIVTADGCCTNGSDCLSGYHCDAESTCIAGPGCGDNVMQGGEQCDDGNQVAEVCPYGETSCVVCGATCQMQQGDSRYCGDDVIDPSEDEECEPPGTSTCSDDCIVLVPVESCDDGEQNGDETDVDCGGDLCDPCGIDGHCLIREDCIEGSIDECADLVDCVHSAATGASSCMFVPPCDDGLDCTRDSCIPSDGCVSQDIDADFDESTLCEGDCNDADSTVFPGSREICNRADDDCDGRMDEMCTAT